jgi:protein scribble
VVLNKDGGPLGLSIIGGVDQSSVPYGGGANDGGVFISKVVAGGVACRSGSLRPGDRILSVNGVPLEGATHADAVRALVSAGTVVTLCVRHDPLPPGFKEVLIDRRPGERLGMNIKGGRRGQPGNPLDPNDEGIFVSKVRFKSYTYSFRSLF